MLTGVAGFLIIASAIWAVLLALAIKPVGSVELNTNTVSPQPTNQKLTFSWPTQGAAAIGMDGKIKADFNGDESRAMASLTKIVTALVVLDKKPIAPGEVGEVLTMNDTDVALYEKAKTLNGSNIVVKAGENINEIAMLQAMMLVSANNAADSLAIWAFGSVDDYVAAANDWLTQNGFADTKVVDASGFDSKSVSTAKDLVKLAMLADKNATLKSVFSAKEAQFPGVGKITNTNTLLGINGIYGMKTGHTEAAGANLLFASTYKVGNVSKTIYGVVLGQTDANLFQVAKDFNNSAQSNINKVVVLAKGSVVGRLTSRWGATSNVVLSADLTTVGWKDENNVQIDIKNADNLGGMTSVANGQNVGTASAGADGVTVITSGTLYSPDFLWRVTNPF